eukprot:2752827-Amphidinium_carterae.8
MPQVTMTRHFNKLGIHEGTPEEINIQQLRTALNITALGSPTTPDEDSRSKPHAVTVFTRASREGKSWQWKFRGVDCRCSECNPHTGPHSRNE